MSGFTIPARPDAAQRVVQHVLDERRRSRPLCSQEAWDRANTAYARLGRFVAAKEAGEPYEPIQHPKREEFR